VYLQSVKMVYPIILKTTYPQNMHKELLIYVKIIYNTNIS